MLEANGKFYASVRRGSRGLAICQAPHVIVSAVRNFAVYEERYLVVPPRQIGIVSPTGDRQFLKALSLYLSSDFAFYHQFLTSTELGVKRDRATLGALRNMPISIRDLSADRRKQWEDLHTRLMRTTPQSVRESQESVTGPQQLTLLPDDEQNDETVDLLRELNGLVSESLELDAGEEARPRFGPRSPGPQRRKDR